jgi:FMN phosphatase YigB (HAD superfamily)
MTAPRALLFDLGGVVIDIDFQRAIDAWQPLSREPRAAMVDALHSSVRFEEEHERGEIEDAVFFEHIAATLALEGDETHIANGWNDIFIGPIDETLDLIRVARERVPCFAFTNTNRAHHAVWAGRFPQVVDAFEHVFVSYEIGRASRSATRSIMSCARSASSRRRSRSSTTHRRTSTVPATPGSTPCWSARPQTSRPRCVDWPW